LAAAGSADAPSLLSMSASLRLFWPQRSGRARMNDDQAKGEEESALRARLADLRQQHADLDAAVAALETAVRPDQIQLARIKKRKLALRDLIVRLEDQLTPDIIA
jgi:hypothetical protein